MSQWKSLDTIAKNVQSGLVSAESNVDKALKIIAGKNEYNVVIATVDDRAKKRAREIDARVKNGEKVGRLAGVPFIAKDNFLTYGSETTAASNILKGFTAPYQSTAIERLEDEGAICVAKANLDAFAHGSSTENSDFMITKNPHDKTRVPGGSSGGSAAAVILEMVPFALGTDTGGSIRLPASFCGAVGFKPTYGLVSRSGVVAMASSTDVIGPIAKNVRDVALVMDVVAGTDELDSTTISRDAKGYEIQDYKTKIKSLKVGLIKEYFTESLDSAVRDTLTAAIQKLESNGVEISETSLPSLNLSLAAYYIIVPAEISSNLSRYDGQHYGYSNIDAQTLDESYNWSRSEGFGREVKRRIMIGTYVLSSGYYDAYYKKAQQLRTKLIGEFNRVFDQVDFLIGPVAPTTAFRIGENTSDPMQMYLADIMTVAASLTGIPAISVPAGVADNLPVGMQIMSSQKTDRSLLSFAASIEEIVK